MIDVLEDLNAELRSKDKELEVMYTDARKRNCDLGSIKRRAGKFDEASDKDDAKRAKLVASNR